MRLFYKKVGDTFTLDEYNAMCYLLSLQTYKDTFDMSVGSSEGEYATYRLDNKDKCIMETQNGFTIIKSSSSFKILINSYIPNASFYATFTIYENDTTIEHNNITSTIPSNEIYDKIEDSTNKNEEKITSKIEVKAENNIITFKPQTYGLVNTDWIAKEIKIRAVYDEPIINRTDGKANLDSEIICETFEELEQVITTLPENKHVDIRLKGWRTYEFTKEIIIKDKKSVTITGGNYNNGSYAILDGKDQYRHFYVGAGSRLTIRNCHMTNGNGSKIHDYIDSPQRGGSIFMVSNFKHDAKGYAHNPSFVTIENCKFSNCHANRGGAIYNLKSKLTCNNVEFENCVATKDGDKTPCWGGAIMNESVTFYHDASNQLYIDKSTTAFNTDSTIIDLKISQTQNLRHFTNNNYTIPTLTCICGNNKYTVTTVKTSQFEYLLTINGVLKKGDKFYFTCKDFITRNLTIIKEGTSHYTIVVPEVID